MSLKDLTMENHKKAERAAFVRRLMKKELTINQYYIYLCNQAIMYAKLEFLAEKAGVLVGIEDIERTYKMIADIQALKSEYPFSKFKIYDATTTYIDYLETLKDDPHALLAHVYVRHMGDLSGGQIIKKYLPGPATHYDFDCDVDDLKERVRAKLDDSLADEANKCFDAIQEIFQEMELDFSAM
jgi:heme oxygenase